MAKTVNRQTSNSSNSKAPKPMNVRAGVSTSRRRYEGGGKAK